MIQLYLAIYKPYMMVSQFSPEGDKATLKDLQLELPNDVYPVGRLDNDSEGLLLLTNDKKINSALLHPKQAHRRTYYVQVEGIPTLAQLQLLSKGVTITIDGKTHKTLPCTASFLHNEKINALPERTPPIRFRANIPTTWISLTLTEGKNRQVRKMTAAIGFPTLRLVRYSIEEITIKGMKAGEAVSLDKKLFLKKLKLQGE